MTADDHDPAATPARALEFRLIGAWEQFAAGSSKKLDDQVDAYVERIVGKSDDRALVRIGMRERIRAGLAAAEDGSAQSLFLCSEIAPGVPMPVVMTVYAPETLRMTPAEGTSPEAVMEAFRAGRRQLYDETDDDWGTLEIPEALVLRTARAGDVALHPEAPDATVPNLEAQYWYTTPGSKTMVLVTFFTPLADLRNVMLEFFDSIVRASRFAPAPTPA